MRWLLNANFKICFTILQILSPDLRSVILTLNSDRKKFKDPGKFNFPCGVACDREDNIYIVDSNNKRLVQVSKDGKFMKEIYPAGKIFFVLLFFPFFPFFFESEKKNLNSGILLPSNG